MDPKHPTPRPPTQARRSLTASSPDQGKQDASHEPREELPSVATPGLFIPRSGPLMLLARTVHQAIKAMKMDGLRQQVSNYGLVTLELRNERGMTPLYHAVSLKWTEAALFLLRCGARVSSSEHALLSFLEPPFMQLVMETEDTELLAEVIKRGANIRATDYKGNNCVSLDKAGSWKARVALFDCLAETVADQGPKRPDLLKDLFFIIRVGTADLINHDKIEQFITRRGGRHQAELFQVFAACCCSPFCDYNQALHYWRKSAECTPHQFESQMLEEDLACGSVLTDILDVTKHPLPTTVTTRADSLAMNIRAFLAFEKFMPNFDFLVEASTNRIFCHLQENRSVSIIAILCRLTTIRSLHWRDVVKVLHSMGTELSFCAHKGAVPFPAFLDAMKAIKNCLTALQSAHPEAYQSSPSGRGDLSKLIFRAPFDALLTAMVIFYGNKVAATPEELQIFTSHVKDCIQRFPWARCLSFLNLLATEDFHFVATEDLNVLARNGFAPIPASIIKVIVTCSAEAFGTIRQGYCPLHLMSDANGYTLLHVLAMNRSREVLVQEGVLQCFLDHGAHLCTRSNRGNTVRGILVWHRVCTEGELLPSLKCLAAVAFMKDERLRQTVGNCHPAAVRNFLLDH